MQVQTEHLGAFAQPLLLWSSNKYNTSAQVFATFGTGFSWFPSVYKRMLRWFPRLPVATACFSCSPPDLNFLDPYFIFMYMHYNHCHRATAHLLLNILLSKNSSTMAADNSTVYRLPDAVVTVALRS